MELDYAYQSSIAKSGTKIAVRKAHTREGSYDIESISTAWFVDAAEGQQTWTNANFTLHMDAKDMVSYLNLHSIASQKRYLEFQTVSP